MTFARFPTILFLADNSMPAARWSHFVAYFTRQGFSCYASDLSSLREIATLPPSPVVVACRWARLTAPAAALAILSPATGFFLNLMRRPPDLPVWLGVGEQMRVQRLLAGVAVYRLRATTPYVFQGLGHDLIATPGWERVAYALRLWMQRFVVSEPATRS